MTPAKLLQDFVPINFFFIWIVSFASLLLHMLCLLPWNTRSMQRMSIEHTFHSHLKGKLLCSLACPAICAQAEMLEQDANQLSYKQYRPLGRSSFFGAHPRLLPARYPYYREIVKFCFDTPEANCLAHRSIQT
jgi:hypothetical protein